MSSIVSPISAVDLTPLGIPPINTVGDIAKLLECSPEQIESAYENQRMPEIVRMALAILRGSQMGPNGGWFGPEESRYSWQWLASLHGLSESDAIERAAFQGDESWFEILDRDRDGKVTAEDLDWSDSSLWVQQTYQANRLFRRIDKSGSGKVTREAWLAFFDRMTGGDESFGFEAFRDSVLGNSPAMAMPTDMPTREMLIDGLLAAELGSPFEGPKVGDTAPDFCLQTHDGGQTIRLSEMIGSLPVVLVFGNFTCGPFRSMFTVADAIAKQFDSQAKFVGVYVREAHPVDGWRMGSNDAVGIEVTQPQTYDQRVEHACRCRKLLNASMPMLVDEIDDPTGHAYSGMPDRMYVIDRDGKVAFKSGRGPFGFKTGQMAQALVMALLEQYTSTQTSGAGK